MNKKHMALVVKFLISAVLIWYLLGSIDLDAAWEKLRGADPLFLLMAGLVILGQVLICVFRWQSVMVAISSVLSFMKATQIFFIGAFFNQALPSSVGGDAVRMYKAYKSGLTLSGAVNGVMLERLVTVVGLIILVVFATPFFIERVGSEDAAWIVPAVTMIGLGGAAGLVLLMFLDRLPSRFSHWRIIRGLAMLAADTRRVFLQPAHTTKALFWSIAGNANITLAVFLMAMSLGLEVTWLDCLILVPPVILITTLPISIAGWGVREGAMVTAFGLVGVPAEGALVLSLMFGLWGIAMGLPGGVIWLLSRDRKIETVETSADAR